MHASLCSICALVRLQISRSKKAQSHAWIKALERKDQNVSYASLPLIHYFGKMCGILFSHDKSHFALRPLGLIHHLPWSYQRSSAVASHSPAAGQASCEGRSCWTWRNRVTLPYCAFPPHAWAWDVAMRTGAGPSPTLPYPCQFNLLFLQLILCEQFLFTLWKQILCEQLAQELPEWEDSPS